MATEAQAQSAPEVEQSPEAMLEAQFAKRYGEGPAEDEQDGDDIEAGAGDDVEAAEPGEVDDAPQDDGENIKTTEADDLEDADIDGETFKLPKKVRDAVMRTKDYTQKTQELANMRRLVEDRSNFLEFQQKIQEQGFSQAAKVQSLREQLAQFDNVDWNGIIQADHSRALALSLQQQQLQSQLRKEEQGLNQLAGKVREATEAHKAEQMKLGAAELDRRLGKLSDRDRTSMLALGQSLGFSERDMMSPAALHALHMAAKFDALQKAKPQIEKRVSQAKPMATPSARGNVQSAESAQIRQLKERAVKSGRPQDMEDFLARRFAQASKARKR